MGHIGLTGPNRLWARGGVRRYDPCYGQFRTEPEFQQKDPKPQNSNSKIPIQKFQFQNSNNQICMKTQKDSNNTTPSKTGGAKQ